MDSRLEIWELKSSNSPYLAISKHKRMVHELPMFEVQTDVLGEALMQPNSRHGMDRKDNESPMNIR